jgi:hypothetical protein
MKGEGNRMFRSTPENFGMSDEEYLANLVRLPVSEEEWLSCDEPPKLMAALLEGSRSPTDRKIRLYACAVAALYLSAHPADICFHKVLAVAERFADGGATADELQQAGREAQRRYQWQTDDTALQVVRHAAYLQTRGSSNSVRYATSYTYFDSKTNALLFRCIFGNPYRPVSVDPTWLTLDVVTLAEGIYQERAFDRLPILADALQDAGCDNTDILSHCHSEGPHVRGCWPVDLIFGKS